MGVKIARTSWTLTLIGLVVVAGGLLVSGALQSGAYGFGLAFIVLGLFDMLRPKVND